MAGKQKSSQSLSVSVTNYAATASAADKLVGERKLMRRETTRERISEEEDGTETQPHNNPKHRKPTTHRSLPLHVTLTGETCKLASRQTTHVNDRTAVQSYRGNCTYAFRKGTQAKASVSTSWNAGNGPLYPKYPLFRAPKKDAEPILNPPNKNLDLILKP